MSAKGRRYRGAPASDRASHARLSPFPSLLTPATQASLLSSMTTLYNVNSKIN